MEALWPSETSVDFRQTKQRHIPDDVTLDSNHCEKLRFKITLVLRAAVSYAFSFGQ
jgi:hypothetical protein